MLNFMLFITFVIFVAIVIANLGIILPNLRIFFPHWKPKKLSVFTNEHATNSLDQMEEKLEDKLENLKFGAQKNQVMIHQLQAEMDKVQKDIDAHCLQIKSALDKNNDLEAKRLIKNLGRKETQLEKLGTTLTEAKSNYESILLVRDDIKAELCEIQRKKLEWKLDETLEIENLEDEDQDDETMLLEAAEDAEVENRLQEFKRNMTAVTPLEFAGYVFCFWALWKGYDFILHLGKSQIAGDMLEPPPCQKCIRTLEANQKLVVENEKLKSKVDKPASSVLNKGVSANGDYVALGPDTALNNPYIPCYTGVKTQQAIARINRASKKDLMVVKGIGPAHADRIRRNRPFSTDTDLRKLLPSSLVNKLISHFEAKGVAR